MTIQPFVDYSTEYDIPYQQYEEGSKHRKYVMDLYVPVSDHHDKSTRNGDEQHKNLPLISTYNATVSGKKEQLDKNKRRRVDGNLKDERSRRDRKPPVVVFVHGGGWRRGDKSAWRHFVSTDINLLAACIYWFYNLYGNVGHAMAKRGVACAVISYPLITLQTPWLLLELISSYMCSVLFLGTLFGLFLTCLVILKYVLSLSVVLMPYLEHFSLILPHFGSECLLYHGTISNICILLLISYQYTHYQLYLVHVAILWTILTGCFCIFQSFEYLIHIVFMTSFVLSQGILVLYAINNDRKNPKDQMMALARCIHKIRSIATETGDFDAEEVVLMGHSAGAHLSSLTSLDFNFLESTGLHHNCIKGVIIISGVLHVEKLNKSSLRPLYLHPGFGKDEQTWRELCPTNLLRSRSKTSLPRFFIVTANSDYHLQEEAEEFSKELETCGASVMFLQVPRTGHLSIICHFDKFKNHVNLADMCSKFVLQ